VRSLLGGEVETLCFERSDLTRLAFMAERLAATLSLEDASANDTHLGVDD